MNRYLLLDFYTYYDPMDDIRRLDRLVDEIYWEKTEDPDILDIKRYIYRDILKKSRHMDLPTIETYFADKQNVWYLGFPYTVRKVYGDKFRSMQSK